MAWLSSDEGRDDIADRHWISQYRFLYKDDECLCDFIGRYENLEEDWKKACAEIGIEHQSLNQKGYISATGKTENPAELNSNKKIVKSNYQDFYTNQTRDIIRTRYQKDIELFGYEFET